MPDRQWPATKLGSAWMTHDPDDGWYEYDNPSDAENAFGQIVDHLRDEASEAWHESADTAAWGIWIPIERLRLHAKAWPEDDTEDGERCRDAGWDAILDGVVEAVPHDSAALDFCGRRAAETIAALRAERDEARAVIARIAAACATIDCEDLAAALTTPADYDDLVSHVEALANPKPDPLRALLAHLEANDAEVEITHTVDDEDGGSWMISYTIDGSGSWAEGPLDASVRKMCKRLGVSDV